MDDSFLEARGYNEIFVGGYEGEIKGVEQAYENWAKVPMNNLAGVDSYYYYRDSNVSKNEVSAETKVYIRTGWEATADDSNVITITTYTYVTGVEKYIPAGSSGMTLRQGRQIRAYAPSTPCGPSAQWTSVMVPVSYYGGIAGSPGLPVLISKNTYTLPPQATSESKSAIVVRNVVEGYEYRLCDDSPSNIYLDAMYMGFQFRNNLPNDLPIPVLHEVEQTPDICENVVDLIFTFEPISIGGAELYLEYKFGNLDWSEDRSVAKKVIKGSPTTVTVYGLPPTNHTKNPVVVYWRAKYRPSGSTLLESDWLYEDTQIMYIPAPNMTVPDITTPECNLIARGEFVPQWTSEQCYNEWSCADQEGPEMLEEEQKLLEECRIMNGVGE